MVAPRQCRAMFFVGLSVVFGVASQASAQSSPAPSRPPAPALWIGGIDDGCPSPENLRGALLAMMPDLTFAAGPGERVLVVRLRDEGDAYHIGVGGSERTLFDPDHLCDKRAKTAAVIIALILNPPDVAGGPAPALPVTAPVAPKIQNSFSASRSLTSNRVIFDSSGFVEVAPGSLISGGLGMMLEFGRGPYGLIVGGEALTTSTLELGTRSLPLTRVPLEIGARKTYPHRASETAVDVGAQGTLLLIPDSVNGQTRFEVGVRIAALQRFLLPHPLAPFASIEMSFFPRPYKFDVPIGGTVGETPVFWVGVALGFSLRLL